MSPRSATGCRSGSIPAGAGKPRRSCAVAVSPRVYPRGRGEASDPINHLVCQEGLSPRARGSPIRAIWANWALLRGLSPRARGSRCSRREICGLIRVYPRGRGEAQASRLEMVKREGSIPAGAGKPIGLALAPGGHQGLSPRARGSHHSSNVARSLTGSIPAGAGKPDGDVLAIGQFWVYPRGRGEAPLGLSRGDDHIGLSPRARGSRCAADSRHGECGSIPAGAGKPCSR